MIRCIYGRIYSKKIVEFKKFSVSKTTCFKKWTSSRKTWISKEFGGLYYENTAYFNFDENEEYKQSFLPNIHLAPHLHTSK